jgi:hypothetical protein
MKTLMLILILSLPMVTFGQSIDVLGHHFAVGDTIQFTTGTMPNGEFMSTSIAPGLMSNSDGTVEHLSSTYNNMRFIIKKIKTTKLGINVATILVIKASLLNVWVDANTAINKKEIVLK